MMDGPKLEKIDSKTLRERVYEQLREKIVYGDIRPGETVTLRKLAEQFGVSVIPVREALWQLESERAVIIERNKSIRIKALSAAELREVVVVRIDLESRLGRKACEVRDDSVITTLKKLVDEMDLCTDEPRQYLAKNSEFHFTIYSIPDMPLHLHLISELWARIGPYLTFHAEALIAVSHAMLYHHKMVEALDKRDADGLVAALRGDIEDAANFISRFLQ